jgi:hypothetical protein
MTTSIKFKENREHHTLIGNELYPRFWSATPIFSAISTDLEKTTFPQKFDNDTKSSIHALTAICILKTIANSAAQNIEFLENRDLILSCASSLGKEHSILIASIVDSLWRNGLFVLTNQLAVCSLYLFSDESTAADLLQCADTRVVTKEEAIACLIPSSIEYLRDHINAMRFQYAGENSPY